MPIANIRIHGLLTVAGIIVLRRRGFCLRSRMQFRGELAHFEFKVKLGGLEQRRLFSPHDPADRRFNAGRVRRLRRQVWQEKEQWQEARSE